MRVRVGVRVGVTVRLNPLGRTRRVPFAALHGGALAPRQVDACARVRIAHLVRIGFGPDPDSPG